MDLKGPKIKSSYERSVVRGGKKVDLKEFDPEWAMDDSMKHMDGEQSRVMLGAMLEKYRADLSKVQELLWASHSHSVLIILQGMDTAGKDGTIRHVMSGMNPQGCSVHSFKVPSVEESSHDFLWRYQKVLPQRGEICIFNRSYYEDVLVVRVHPTILADLPPGYGPGSDEFWESRYTDINALEKHLAGNGTVVLKFFLHISKNEQKKRLLGRLEDPEKYWKFSVGDLAERKYWADYKKAYERMLEATSTAYAPWFVVPGDHKWVARTFVADCIVTAIQGLDLAYPEVGGDQIGKLMEAKKSLESE